MQTSSFKRFLKSVGIESSNSSSSTEQQRRSASLPCKAVKSTSTFYGHSSNGDLPVVGCDVPYKAGWLLKQSRGVLRTWQVRYSVIRMTAHSAKAQIPLRRLSPKLPHRESRGHKS